MRATACSVVFLFERNCTYTAFGMFTRTNRQTDPYTNACKVTVQHRAQPTITTIIINGKEKRDSINSTHCVVYDKSLYVYMCIRDVAAADGLLKVIYYASTFVINLCSQ